MGRAVILGALALVAVGCGRPEGDVPVIEERSLTFLADGLERTAADLDDAARQLDGGELDGARRALAAAGEEVRALRSYFLPLLEARELAHLARHSWTVGRPAEVGQRLDEVEALLAEASAAMGSEVQERLREPLSAVQQIEVAIESEPDAVAERLEDLERHLNNLALKGELLVGHQGSR